MGSKTSRLLAALPLAASIAGCANLNSVYRPLDLHGRAVAIDGYQTPIFSDVVETEATSQHAATKRVVVCPSPPVDAIASHSFGGGLTNSFTGAATSSATGAKDNAQLSLADAMAAASIGLRTNSTTLLSYNSAWNCLAYMGGATGDPKFMELARRNQNITLGILAIEQLTGVAQAGQAALNGNAASATGAENTDSQAANVDAAKKDRDASLAALDQKNLALRDAQGQQTKADKDVAEARKTLAALPTTATADQRAAAQKNIDDAVTTQNTQVKAVASAELDVTAAQRDVARNNQAVSAAEDALTLAQGRVKASASASASVTAAGGPHAASTKEVAAAVKDIVANVLFESGRGEACNSVFEDFLAKPEKYASGTSGQQLFNVCIQQKAISNAKEASRLNLRLN